MKHANVRMVPSSCRKARQIRHLVGFVPILFMEHWKAEEFETEVYMLRNTEFVFLLKVVIV